MVDHRSALELLWKGTCTIYVRQEAQNPINKRTEFTEVPIYSDKPCKLSFQNIKSTTDSNNAASVTQIVKLFIASDLNIPAGSKITVTQNGKTADYKNSGEPGMFSNHQEVVLELFKGWA